MKARQLLVLGALMASFAGGHALAQTVPYQRIADIEVDPLQLESYRAFLREVIETSVRQEPGVLGLSAVADKDNPAHIFVFEIYADLEAYRAHIETPHFIKYKSGTRDMVRSLKLLDVVPIAQSAKAPPIHEPAR